MHTASSASRTCIASASAVEWAATVRMPISWHARWIRSAISPRLAIRTFSIVTGAGLFDNDERLIIFSRLGVLDQNCADLARARSNDRVHHLHCLDDQQRVAGG